MKETSETRLAQIDEVKLRDGNENLNKAIGDIMFEHMDRLDKLEIFVAKRNQARKIFENLKNKSTELAAKITEMIATVPRTQGEFDEREKVIKQLGEEYEKTKRCLNAAMEITENRSSEVNQTGKEIDKAERSVARMVQILNPKRPELN